MSFIRLSDTPEASGGRFIVIGDIHGMYNAMLDLFDQVDFDPAVDVVIATGDLINRGPDSERVLEQFARQTGFYSVRGNHEDMICKSLTSKNHFNLLENHGGKWFTEQPDDKRLAIAQLLGELPIAIEFESGGKRFGVVHATLPLSVSWKEMTKTFSGGASIPDMDALSHKMMWTSKRLQKRVEKPVEGLEALFLGHTIHDWVVQSSNQVYLDTGAYGAVYKNGRSKSPKLACAVVDKGVVNIHMVDCNKAEKQSAPKLARA